MIFRSWSLGYRVPAIGVVVVVFALAWWLHQPYEMSGFSTATDWDDNSVITAEANTQTG